MEIRGSVVVVTGASSGIGLATARSFARAGARVVMAARSQEKLEAAAEALRLEGHEALAVTTDVREQAQVDRLIDVAHERFGRVDMLMNNAARGSAGLVADTPAEHFRELFSVNVLGPLYAMQAVIPRMRESGRGLIMNVSSGASRRAIPGLSAYGASKAALDLITNTAREELLGTNVRILTVYPPNTDTDAAKNMMGDPSVAIPLLMGFLGKVLKDTAMAPVSAESVANKIVEEAARSEPTDLLLDVGLFRDS